MIFYSLLAIFPLQFYLDRRLDKKTNRNAVYNFILKREGDFRTFLSSKFINYAKSS
jgi:hypothetical protein